MSGFLSKRTISERCGSETPLLRVTLFGKFQLAWQIPNAAQTTDWDSRTSARAVFKLLLCAPGRQVSKSLLAGILWPETDEEKARESLRSACKVLRKVLLTPDGDTLLIQHPNGDLLALAEQSRLWVDADAFEELLLAANRASSPDVALELWEQANAMLRGEFLADDSSYEWASHRLVKKRRQVLWMARCRMVRHLADEYMQRGRISLAEELLEQHIVTFPTDQDALYRLLAILEQQGCFEEASILYERAKRLLAATGKQPAKHVSAYYERLQKAAHEQKQREVVLQLPNKVDHAQENAVSVPQHQRMEITQEVHPKTEIDTEVRQLLDEPVEVVSLPVLITPLAQSDLRDPLVASRFAVWSFLIQEESSANRQKILYDKMVDEIMAMVFQCEQSSDQVLVLQQSVFDVVRKFDSMHRDRMNSETQISRRQALQTIAQFPIQLYGLTLLGVGQRTFPAAEEALPLFAAGIAMCWRQYTPEGMQEVRRTLAAYLPALEHFARQTSSQRAAAHLASQGYLLTCLIAEHTSNLDLMESASGLARFYGQIAHDPDLEVAALVRLAVRFGFSNQHLKSLEVYQEAAALPEFGRVSPLLQGRVYAGLAGKYAVCHQATEALSLVAQARGIYPSNPRNDPSYAFASCGQYSLAYFEGVVFEHTGQYKEAASIFHQYGSLTPLTGVPEANRSEHLTHAARIAIKQRDLDAASHYLDRAEEIARSLKHEGLLHDQYELLRSMQLLWSDEPPVRMLQEKMYGRHV